MSDVPTFGGFPLPAESDGYFDAESCEFNSWFNELDGESLPPNRVIIGIEEGESGMPEMRLYIYTEDLGDLIEFRDAVEWQKRCGKNGGKVGDDGKIWVDVSPPLHDNDLGPVILVRWKFRAVGRELGGITPMCVFDENDLRCLAWLAKFETLPASVVYRKDETEPFCNSFKKTAEEATMEAYELDDDIFDADGECVLEFEASIRNGANLLRFARQAKDIAQDIPMPDNWHRMEFDGRTGEQITNTVFWEAAARAFIEGRRPPSPYETRTRNILG